MGTVYLEHPEKCPPHQWGDGTLAQIMPRKCKKCGVKARDILLKIVFKGKPKAAEKAGDDLTEPRILYVPVCEPCLKAEGAMCHTPGCIFIRHRTPAEWPITDLDLFAVDLDEHWRAGFHEACDRIEKESGMQRSARLDAKEPA